MTMQFADQGYKVVYEPNAYAVESASASVKEELKRKIRIAAGGFQAIKFFAHLLDPKKFSFLSFQYLSHRVMRWTVAPAAIITFFISNLYLFNSGPLFKWLGIVQLAFYTLALAGYLFKRLKVTFKLLHIPFYFCMMNYAVFAGFKKFLNGQQAVTWEKAMRRA